MGNQCESYCAYDEQQQMMINPGLLPEDKAPQQFTYKNKISKKTIRAQNSSNKHQFWYLGANLYVFIFDTFRVARRTKKLLVEGVWSSKISIPHQSWCENSRQQQICI